MNNNSSKVIEVSVNEILPNRNQPRINFPEEQIMELAESIKEYGVLLPIVVRTVGDKYEIVAGERRYKASILAGKETVPVIVRNLNDKDSAEIALIENVQRRNLSPIEEALSYKKILDMGYITQEELALKLGKSQSSVANKIRLLNLSDEVQEALLENKISERHARSLLRLPTSKLQNEMLEKITRERLTVRKTDEEIDKLKSLNESLDRIEDDSKKDEIEEEINMNNNLNNDLIQNNSQDPSTMPNFDIFGSNNTQPIEPQPTVEAQPEQAMKFFDMFNQQVPESNINNNATQVVETQSEFVAPQPVMPEMTPIFETQPEVAPMSVEQPQTFNEVPVLQPETIQQPEFTSIMEEQPQVFNEVQEIQPEMIQQPEFIQPQMEQPQENSQMFVEQPQNVQPTSFDMQPVMPDTTTAFETQQVMSIPETSPIIEQPQTLENNMNSVEYQSNDLSENVPNELNNEVENMEANTASEFKMPEPIIITDYNKQYDPVMPQTQENTQPVVNFKEVINAIRECSNKIEAYGFKIDVEEYDLTNIYQVIFKIEK